MNRRDVRAKLGIIPQDPTLFSGSYRQNLDPLVKYSVEDMWSAILKSGIDELVKPKYDRNMTKDEKIIVNGKHDSVLKDIDRWNKKWDSSGWAMRAFLYLFVRKPRLYKEYIEETEPYGLNQYVDNNLSSGQKQLVGLCRLLMRNRKIIVLDEATASVDQESDQSMQKLIRSEFKDCTVLTIAHRLKTIMGSDRIVVLDNGRVVEVGPPSELLEKGGYFAELVKANEF
ncbi:Canalicular multispecific organic anion transporter 1 [Coemansia sp. RSA 2049]|nr:Canalicular multispecific organic anion transporter 1 [Coemansia sp. RSA 2049]KAJ2607179.1 Canalicular multispecific organic anion transporter 1 [Coemansia sp. RSA 1804]